MRCHVDDDHNLAHTRAMSITMKIALSVILMVQLSAKFVSQIAADSILGDLSLLVEWQFPFNDVEYTTTKKKTFVLTSHLRVYTDY